MYTNKKRLSVFEKRYIDKSYYNIILLGWPSCPVTYAILEAGVVLSRLQHLAQGCLARVSLASCHYARHCV